MAYAIKRVSRQAAPMKVVNKRGISIGFKEAGCIMTLKRVWKFQCKNQKLKGKELGILKIIYDNDNI